MATNFRRYFGVAMTFQQDLLLALHHVQDITNLLRLYADVHPQVSATRDRVFQLLFDPRQVTQHDGPQVIAVMRMLLRPLWVRRQRLEREQGPTPRFPEELQDHVVGEIFKEWQHAWYHSNEIQPWHRTSRQKRNAWFAHLKQSCGGAVWTKLLLQYGPGRMSTLLGAVLDARDDRETPQAAIMPVARAAMRQGTDAIA